LTQIKVSQQIAAYTFATHKWTLEDFFFFGTLFRIELLLQLAHHVSEQKIRLGLEEL
jgi:hypothetical protein